MLLTRVKRGEYVGATLVVVCVRPRGRAAADCCSPGRFTCYVPPARPARSPPAARVAPPKPSTTPPRIRSPILRSSLGSIRLTHLATGKRQPKNSQSILHSGIARSSQRNIYESVLLYNNVRNKILNRFSKIHHSQIFT